MRFTSFPDVVLWDYLHIFLNRKGFCGLMDMRQPGFGTGAFSSVTEKGMQVYAENVAKSYELTDQIVQSIREGNEYRAVEILRERNSLGAAGRLEDEVAEWKYDLIQIKALIIQALRHMGMADLLLDGIHTEFTQRIHQAVSAEECRSLSEEMVRRFCRMHERRATHNYPVLVQKIILAVDMDLSQNLTLQYFANELNVNDSYLSNLFRCEVGMTITDYVTERRISRAADLLLATRDPIKMVAKQVGIMDVHYFSRLFKKRMGKTPSRYREDRG